MSAYETAQLREDIKILQNRIEALEAAAKAPVKAVAKKKISTPAKKVTTTGKV